MLLLRVNETLRFGLFSDRDAILHSNPGVEQAKSRSAVRRRDLSATGSRAGHGVPKTLPAAGTRE